MTIETVTDLLDALHRGDFLEPGQLDDLTQDASLTAKDARTVARDLIHRGWLTAFQVNQLLAGREKRSLVSPKFSPEGTPALPQRIQARAILIGVGVGMVLLLAVLTFLSLSGESTTPTIPRAPRPTLAVNPLVQFTHALHIHCGKGMGKQQDQVKLPGFDYHLIQGELHDNWKTPAAKSHCWSHPKEVGFELTMPPGTTGKLKLHFVDGGLAGDVKQKLTVAGKFIGEYEGFIGTGKHVEVPITAANTREGKLRVSIEAVGKGAYVSTVELLYPTPKNPPATPQQ